MQEELGDFCFPIILSLVYKHLHRFFPSDTRIATLTTAALVCWKWTAYKMRSKRPGAHATLPTILKAS